MLLLCGKYTACDNKMNSMKTLFLQPINILLAYSDSVDQDQKIHNVHTDLGSSLSAAGWIPWEKRFWNRN